MPTVVGAAGGKVKCGKAEGVRVTINSDNTECPVPERPERSEPRAKKRRPKNYQLLTKP